MAVQDRNRRPCPPSSTDGRAAAAQVADDRRRLQGARAGVPGHLDLEDPLPRGPEAARAAAHARRLPALLAGDVARLRTILRLQRDEFLPLRVIRQELAAGRAERRRRRAPARRRRRRRRAPRAPPERHRARARGALYSLEDVLEETARRAAARRASSRTTASSRARCAPARKYYDETEREIVRAVTELARYGVGGRNLRVFRTSADREAALLQQILAPALRSRNPERRKEARRGAREPRRGRDAPQAPAAHPRPAQDRRLSRPWRSTCDALRPRHPGLPEAGDRLQGHHAAAARPAGARRRGARAGRAARGRCDVDVVVGAEARGFLLGAGARARARRRLRAWRASRASCPHETVRAEYVLEYGTDALEVHTDALARGARVLVHDDLLATGGTARGAVRARRAARRRGRRLRVPDRARVPRRPRAPRRATTSRRCSATTPSRCRVPTTRAAARSPRRADERLGRRRRPAPPAALVAARRARRGRRAATRFTEVLRTDKGRSCAPTSASSSRSAPRAAALGAGARGHAVRARAARGSRPRCALAPDGDGHARDARAAPAAARRRRALGGFMVRRATARAARRGARRRWRRCVGREHALVGLGRADAHAGALPDARAGAAARASSASTATRRAGPSRSRTCACADPALPERACATALRRRSAARRPRRARAARRAASATSTSCASARATATARPTPSSRRATHDEVRAVLEACAAAGVAVVPFGGGTSVVGGVEPLRGGFAARRLARPRARWTRLESLDERSLAGRRSAPGMRAAGGSRRALARARLHARPLPAELRVRDGRRLRRRRARPARPRPATGASTSSSSGVRCAAPAGDARRCAARRRAPPGPTLRELRRRLRGRARRRSRSVALRVRPRPQRARYEGWMFRVASRAGAEALRALEQGGAAPDVARLSDEDETRLALGAGRARRRRRAPRCARYLRRARRTRGGCLAIVGWDGRRGRRARAPRGAARRALRGAGGVAARAARRARRGRARASHGPYLRDDLLDRGVMVETLETATTWSQPARAATARSATRCARAHAPRSSRCHVSHLYPTGASLYFTFIARQRARRRSSSSGARPRRRPARRSSPPAARSPTTTRSAATTRRGMERRGRRRRASTRCARVKARARPGRDHEPRQAAAPAS